MNGRIHSINVSDGGVPKLAVETAGVSVRGVEGDRQAHPKFHGGETRAVSLLGLDAIERLQAEGHPIQAGTTGENLTLEGVIWPDVGLGSRISFENGVALEVLSYAQPCPAIKASFREGDILQVSHKHNPGASRLYARVLQEGRVSVGEAFSVEPGVS